MNKCSGMSWFLYFFIFWKSTINMWKIKWYFYTKEFKGWENFERDLAMMAEKKDLVSSPGLVGTPEWTPVYRAVADDQDRGYEDLQLKMIRSHMRWVGRGGVTVKTHTLRWATNKLGGWSQLQRFSEEWSVSFTSGCPAQGSCTRKSNSQKPEVLALNTSSAVKSRDFTLQEAQNVSHCPGPKA